MIEEEEDKRYLEINDKVLEAINKLDLFVPILKAIAYTGATQSQLKPGEPQPVSIYNHNLHVLKRYQFNGFQKDQSLIQAFTNEYAIMKIAVEHNLHYIMRLQEVQLGVDHVLLRMDKYEMSYRQYLRGHRDCRHVPWILIDVAKGLKELHASGYVHRDLKPENIVLNIKPRSIRIIDFNRAFNILQETKGAV